MRGIRECIRNKTKNSFSNTNSNVIREYSRISGIRGNSCQEIGYRIHYTYKRTLLGLLLLVSQLFSVSQNMQGFLNLFIDLNNLQNMLSTSNRNKTFGQVFF